VIFSWVSDPVVPLRCIAVAAASRKSGAPCSSSGTGTSNISEARSNSSSAHGVFPVMRSLIAAVDMPIRPANLRCDMRRRPISAPMLAMALRLEMLLLMSSR